MKEIFRYGLTLSLICGIATASLAVMNSVTKSRIVAQAKAEEEAGIKEVLPGAVRFDEVRAGNDIIYYKAQDKDGKFIAVAFKAQGKGYSSIIEVLAGMTLDGSITAIKILNQNETPGLGSRIAETFFSVRFSKKNISSLKEVQAISGATISSKAVIDSVSKKAQEIEALIKNESR